MQQDSCRQLLFGCIPAASASPRRPSYQDRRCRPLSDFAGRPPKATCPAVKQPQARPAMGCLSRRRQIGFADYRHRKLFHGVLSRGLKEANSSPLVSEMSDDEDSTPHDTSLKRASDGNTTCPSSLTVSPIPDAEDATRPDGRFASYPAKPVMTANSVQEQPTPDRTPRGFIVIDMGFTAHCFNRKIWQRRPGWRRATALGRRIQVYGRSVPVHAPTFG